MPRTDTSFLSRLLALDLKVSCMELPVTVLLLTWLFASWDVKGPSGLNYITETDSTVNATKIPG